MWRFSSVKSEREGGKNYLPSSAGREVKKQLFLLLNFTHFPVIILRFRIMAKAANAHVSAKGVCFLEQWDLIFLIFVTPGWPPDLLGRRKQAENQKNIKERKNAVAVGRNKFVIQFAVKILQPFDSHLMINIFWLANTNGIIQLVHCCIDP